MVDNYNNEDDFINDESFISWVFGTNDKDVKKWDLWLKNNPDKKPMADKVAAVLMLTVIKENPVNEEHLSDAEAKLRVAMRAASTPAKVINLRRKRIWYSVAAILIVSLAVGVSYFFQTTTARQIATNYGEIMKNKLPDGTEVILNAHSKITLGKTWKEGTAREVWINGEAFFHVKKTPEHDKFIVHTDAFDIEVTGTSFNVKNMNGKSSIILKEGSVTIHRNGEADIKMKPGDYVVYNNDLIQKKTVTKDDYLEWTQNKLVFDNTKLSDVAIMIKDHYGVNVNLQGENIADKTITGIMPNDNLDVLISSLEGTQEFTISRNDSSITIYNKNQ